MGPSDPLGPGTWDQKGLGLFYAFKTELPLVGIPELGGREPAPLLSYVSAEHALFLISSA